MSTTRKTSVGRSADPSSTLPRSRAQLVKEIGARMAAARARARRRGFRELLGQSISLTHLHLLEILRSGGPLPVGAVARTLDISEASATGIVTRMEERGLVRRAREAEDRRVVTVHLARGGEEALARLEGRSRDHFRGLLDRLTIPELKALRAGLRALERAHDEILQSKGQG